MGLGLFVVLPMFLTNGARALARGFYQEFQDVSRDAFGSLLVLKNLDPQHPNLKHLVWAPHDALCLFFRSS